MRLSLSLAVMSSLCACSSEKARAELQLGATTHFSQGWPARLHETVAGAPIAFVRDSIHWNAVETVQGRYEINERNAGHIPRLCAGGKRVVLVTDPRNRLYDAGLTAHSPAARAAYARFLRTIVDRFGNCILALEIGNEINAAANMTGPAARDRAASHAAVLEAVWREIKPAHPGTLILGGSTHSIPTGFLDKLFAKGALQHMDGVAIHPYRNYPANLDWEIERLQTAMRQHGRSVPIWATEFGGDFADREAAPPYLLKMVAQMSTGAVAGAIWYALADQSHFPNMGLYDAAGAPKPVTAAMAQVSALLANGRAERLTLEPGLHAYRFSDDIVVAWGLPRPITIGPRATVTDAAGRTIPPPAWLSEAPIVVRGGDVRFGTGTVLADTLHHYGHDRWTYRLLRKTGTALPMSPIDWTWTSYIGVPGHRAFAVNQHGLLLSPAGTVELSYRVEQSGELHASWCLAPTTKAVSIALEVNGKSLLPPTVVAGQSKGRVPVKVALGDRITFLVGAPVPAGLRQAGYRFRVATTIDHPAEC